jgi:hypothetical protein
MACSGVNFTFTFKIYQFHDSLSSGSWVVSCERTDKTKLLVAFRAFAKVPTRTFLCTYAVLISYFWTIYREGWRSTQGFLQYSLLSECQTVTLYTINCKVVLPCEAYQCSTAVYVGFWYRISGKSNCKYPNYGYTYLYVSVQSVAFSVPVFTKLTFTHSVNLSGRFICGFWFKSGEKILIIRKIFTPKWNTPFTTQIFTTLRGISLYVPLPKLNENMQHLQAKFY